MVDNINDRILRQFQVRVEGASAISPQIAQALLEDQRESDFGDDDELLETIVDLD